MSEPSDAEVERIYEEAYEAAIHAITPFEVSNPYPPTSKQAVIFNSCFVSHYAKLNGK